jgi:alpha-mannosidase
VFRYEYGETTLTQTVSLTAGSRRVDFETETDWRETDRMLRVSFATAISAEEAVCDIQFGSIRRPTRRNTLADAAKDEVCAHKYVDISQGDCGAALLNDCKYGHRVFGGELDLCLLRSYSYPNVNGDRGFHAFTYAFLPHSGDCFSARIPQAAYELNIPLTEAVGAARPSLLTVDAENVIVETIKKAEDGGDVIVRLYEAYGRNADAVVTPGFPVKQAWVCDMMEEKKAPALVDAGKVSLSFKPFEIHTLRVVKG